MVIHLLDQQESLVMERESLEMDVVFVGAGPANLSAAFHLARLVREHHEAAANDVGTGDGGQRTGKPLGESENAVIEKGPPVWSLILSGCVSDERGLGGRIPVFVAQRA